MKKLAIPAILVFWLVILGVAMVFMNRPDSPPHPPPPDIVAPGNVELVQADEGYSLVRITAESGQSVEYSASESTLLEYDGPVRGTPYHLVRQTFKDGDEYTDVVHDGTGSTLRIAGRAVPSMDGGWVASAGSHRALGYSWVDIVELLESEVEGRVHLDAVPLGLLVDGVEWTKSGDLVVSAERDYVTLCDEQDPPELVLTRGEDGGWTTWLDRGRTVSVGEEGRTRIEGLGGDIPGRYVGTMPRREFLAPTYVIDPDWTPAFQPTGPANASRLLLVGDTSTTEIIGWPRWDPEGNGIVTSDLPCGPANGGGKGTG